MKEYFKELKHFYKEDAGKIMIIRTAVITYPVLQFYGFYFGNPIAVIINKINVLQDLFCNLGGYVSEIIPLSSTNSVLKDKINKCNFEMLPFLYRKHQNAQKNISFLSDLSIPRNFQTCNGFQKVFIIAFFGEIPIEYKEYIAGKIHFKFVINQRGKSEKLDEFYHYIVKFVCTNIQAVKLKFKELEESEIINNIMENYPGMEVFYAAEKLLETMIELGNFSVEEKREWSLSLKNSLETIKQEWSLENIEEEWVNTFRCLMFEKAVEIPDILERNKIESTQIDRIDKYPAFDEDFYYIDEGLFKEICNPIAQTINLDKLKMLLSNAGILKGEGKNRQYWTVKVPFINVYGGVSSKRKMRFVRKKIDENNSKSWKEIIQKNLMKNAKSNYKQPLIFWHNNDWSISNEIVNQHMIFIGQSGKGKTVAMRKMEEKIAAEAHVLALNFNQTHPFSNGQKNIKWINVRKEGIPLSLFQMLKSANNKSLENSDLVEIVTDIFNNMIQLGSHQRKLLVDSLNSSIQNISSEKTEFELLLRALRDRSNEGAEGILEKIEFKLKNVKLGMPGELWESGKISILDFSDFPESTQFFLSNLTIFILWNQQKMQKMEDRNKIYIACDEFQSLKMNENSVLTQILCEGRKFDISLLLATQTLSNFDQSSRSLLLQAGTKFYFSTEDKQIRQEIKNASGLSENKIIQEAYNLEKGECFALGDFLVYSDGQKNRQKFLKFSFREEFCN